MKISKFLYLISIIGLCSTFVGCETKSSIRDENTTKEEETTTTKEDVYQMYVDALTNEDIESAKEVVLKYYKENVTYINDIKSILFCDEIVNYKGFVSTESPNIGNAIVFEIRTTEDSGVDYSRWIVLERENKSAEWSVKTEGR